MKFKLKTSHQSNRIVWYRHPQWLLMVTMKNLVARPLDNLNLLFGRRYTICPYKILGRHIHSSIILILMMINTMSLFRWILSLRRKPNYFTINHLSITYYAQKNNWNMTVGVLSVQGNMPFQMILYYKTLKVPHSGKRKKEERRGKTAQNLPAKYLGRFYMASKACNSFSMNS